MMCDPYSGLYPSLPESHSAFIVEHVRMHQTHSVGHQSIAQTDCERTELSVTQLACVAYTV